VDAVAFCRFVAQGLATASPPLPPPDEPPDPLLYQPPEMRGVLYINVRGAKQLAPPPTWFTAQTSVSDRPFLTLDQSDAVAGLLRCKPPFVLAHAPSTGGVGSTGLQPSTPMTPRVAGTPMGSLTRGMSFQYTSPTHEGGGSEDESVAGSERNSPKVGASNFAFGHFGSALGGVDEGAGGDGGGGGDDDDSDGAGSGGRNGGGSVGAVLHATPLFQRIEGARTNFLSRQRYGIHNLDHASPGRRKGLIQVGSISSLVSCPFAQYFPLLYLFLVPSIARPVQRPAASCDRVFSSGGGPVGRAPCEAPEHRQAEPAAAEATAHRRRRPEPVPLWGPLGVAAPCLGFHFGARRGRNACRARERRRRPCCRVRSWGLDAITRTCGQIGATAHCASLCSCVSGFRCCAGASAAQSRRAHGGRARRSLAAGRAPRRVRYLRRPPNRRSACCRCRPS